MALRGYYEQSYPMALLLTPPVPPVPATGATAGIPGAWTPAGSTPPATVAELQGGSIIATPLTGWTAGQYVQTGTAGAAGKATWTGTGWVGGVAPGATEAKRGRRSKSHQDDEAPAGDEG